MDLSVSGDSRRRVECSFSRNERMRKPTIPDLTYPETLLILLTPSRKLESAVRNPRSPPRVLRFMGWEFCSVLISCMLLVTKLGNACCLGPFRECASSIDRNSRSHLEPPTHPLVGRSQIHANEFVVGDIADLFAIQVDWHNSYEDTRLA